MIEFVEKPDKPSGNLVNAGIYVLSREIVDRVPAEGPSSIERDVFPVLAREGRLYATVEDGMWYDFCI